MILRKLKEPPLKNQPTPVEVAFEVAFKPIPGTSQVFALDTRAHHTLYHGTRGPGKTITQLMRFRRRVGQGYGSFWRGVIFDREFKNLADIVAQSKRFFTKFNDGAKFLEAASEYKWVWPTGEELLFRHIKKLADYDNFHGHEYPFIGWNELTKYPTPDLYEKLMSCNRSSFRPEDFPQENEDGSTFLLPKIPLEVFSTTNSNGPGHNWVKFRFIDAAPMGQLVVRECEVFDPQKKENVIVRKTQVAIFGSYRENIYLSPEYIAELDAITDVNLRKAWLFGSWDVVSGGAFDDLWRVETHRIARFAVPAGWHLDRSFDWGSTHPFDVRWWAEADGTEAVFPNGTKFCPPRGTLVCVAEWYGTKQIGFNRGLKMSAKDIAAGIREREIKFMQEGWFAKQPVGGPADNQIRDVRESDVETIEDKMADEGIRWIASDKSPGSRKIGLQLFRDRLQASLRKEGAGIYYCDNCTAALTIIPSLQRDPDNLDDIDSDSEDHPWDGTRYRVLKSTNRFATNIPVSIAH